MRAPAAALGVRSRACAEATREWTLVERPPNDVAQVSHVAAPTVRQESDARLQNATAGTEIMVFAPVETGGGIRALPSVAAGQLSASRWNASSRGARRHWPLRGNPRRVQVLPVPLAGPEPRLNARSDRVWRNEAAAARSIARRRVARRPAITRCRRRTLAKRHDRSGACVPDPRSTTLMTRPAARDRHALPNQPAMPG